MASIFKVFDLGTVADIDPTEGNGTSENGASLEGITFGAAGDPLYARIKTFAPGSVGPQGTTYDPDNNIVPNDNFTIDGGLDQTFDSCAIYFSTLIYADGTTAAYIALVFQDTAGRLYLAPQFTNNAEQAALEAKPIRAISLDSEYNYSTVMTASRVDGAYVTPDGTIDGTTGSDTIDIGYTDAQGDVVDGFDGDEDHILGGEGADTIFAGNGNDLVYGGLGDDAIGDFGANDSGNDTMFGDDGNDVVIGGAGNDTVFGGAGNDYLSGQHGDDTLYGGDGSDLFTVTDDHESDTIYGGTDGSFDILYLGEYLSTQGVNVTFTGDEAGSYAFDGTAAAGSFAGITGIGTTAFADVIDASASAVVQYLAGAGGADMITGGGGADILYGGADDDQVLGGAGNDTLDAGDGNDTLSGGDGGDILDGGVGNDTVTGGDGDDIYYYSVGDGADVITDFNFGNTGGLTDGNVLNNDFIFLFPFYDTLYQIWADQADDGILNQSNAFDTQGNVADYSSKSLFGAGSLTFTGATANNTSFTFDNTGVVCFTSGTAILTPQGEVLIDDLRPGDLVVTLDDGPRPIRWIGRRHVDRAALAAHPNLRPVRIERGVLGAKRRMFVSPQHGMLIGPGGFHLARAKHLAAGTPGIRIAHRRPGVTYLHLMFDAHQIIFAEGVPTESFFPGPMAMAALDRAARADLVALFPEYATFGDPARLSLPRRAVTQLHLAA